MPMKRNRITFLGNMTERGLTIRDFLAVEINDLPVWAREIRGIVYYCYDDKSIHSNRFQIQEPSFKKIR